jgi:RNA polymerase sigma-70 factor (ECF subfamily)
VVDEDGETVRRVLGGDLDAFEGIVRRWQGPLYRLAWRFARDESVAEEMVQIALIRVYRALGTWRAESAFSTWLFAVATNSFRSTLRRLGPPAAPIEDAWDAPAPAGLLAGSGRDEVVRHAVIKLPPKYRDAILLFYFHDRSVEETAAVLGVPAGTVKARLHRGRKLLERTLARWLKP